MYTFAKFDNNNGILAFVDDVRSRISHAHLCHEQQQLIPRLIVVIIHFILTSSALLWNAFQHLTYADCPVIDC